jgi:hypothetical protein
MLVSFFSPTILYTWPIMTWERFKPTVPRSWQDSFDVSTREKNQVRHHITWQELQKLQFC